MANSGLPRFVFLDITANCLALLSSFGRFTLPGTLMIYRRTRRSILTQRQRFPATSFTNGNRSNQLLQPTPKAFASRHDGRWDERLKDASLDQAGCVSWSPRAAYPFQNQNIGAGRLDDSALHQGLSR